jgi:peroxiredoxin
MLLWTALASAALVLAAPPKGLAVGDKAPDFQNLPTVDGKTVSLKDFQQDVFVLVVTCNECPVARSYEPRLIEFAKLHCGPDGPVGLLAVNLYDREGDTLDDMKARASEMQFNFPYAQDASQKLGKDLGATKTPHVFVFDKDRRLVYRGAFDDNWMDAEAVKKHFVEDAVAAAIGGGEPPACNEPVGCSIHYNR